jgi:RecA-family ATPase
VIVDPLAAFLAGVDAHVDQSVRRALHPISKLAESSGAAVVVIRHLNKAPGGKAMYRGGGSIGITGAARAVHLVAADPDDDSRRLLPAVKINVARKPSTDGLPVGG